ncbi:hypothetical protein L596_007933 [Steinernema carpocapsae]|uniref:Uncharacterized protein n=1 Tax=Steinernema carpocapsae TaxID=34508 RepID=A0A4U5PBX5_STECR|nr:hypothetical protein L596_007933 [Steinernema carpocapsae]
MHYGGIREAAEDQWPKEETSTPRGGRIGGKSGDRSMRRGFAKAEEIKRFLSDRTFDVVRIGKKRLEGCFEDHERLGALGQTCSEMAFEHTFIYRNFKPCPASQKRQNSF